ncbi:hypothetical protein HLB23_17650 [Nocardia uniformis]|uniref:Uncharacterized protein n=1 Tax=Nocardia uniformis TaxID=53432 RepID=A0A849BYN5_9NOCA|nr:hypothetical protein [Nocardia uniformis]NNH71663.1 hypothetical protein [Nocardia uniformis]
MASTVTMPPPRRSGMAGELRTMATRGTADQPESAPRPEIETPPWGSGLSGWPELPYVS